MVRYSFPVGLFQSLLHAGLSRRSHTLADLIDLPCAIAMQNDPRVRRAVAKGILALFDIAGVYARGRDPNAHLKLPWLTPRAAKGPLVVHQKIIDR
jgi:hypothetical protein